MKHGDVSQKVWASLTTNQYEGDILSTSWLHVGSACSALQAIKPASFVHLIFNTGN